jgi:uncharacterized protein YegL
MQKAEINICSKVNEVFAKTLVTHKILNNSDKPIELEVYIDRYSDNNIFSSFEAQIGDSKRVKSKVIKEEKAEVKYTDSVASGNAAIYTIIDKEDKNKIIVHIGNIPPKEELTFISEFIQYIESANNSYEYEFLRNVPLMKNKGDDIPNDIIKGILEIETKSKIIDINKKFLFDKMIIEEEKHDKGKNSFTMKYKYKIDSIKENTEEFQLNFFLNNFSSYNSKPFYISASKLLFNLESNNALFYQNSLKNKDEQSFIFNYKITDNKNSSSNKNKEDIKLNPALFIFLIDQSGSMSGSPIKVASKALLLFLQSLPAGSYYQIIGFGSKYKIYDNIPKEYNQKNLQKSIEIVENLKGDMGGTDIYAPLEYIYKSKNYEKVLLPRNIFLLTDGEINDKKETLALIEKNSNEFSVYSFGIGNDFDEDLIKNAGIVGKGNYSFCKDIKGLNQIIVSNLNDICTSFINNFDINSNLDSINLYNTRNIDRVMKQNKIYRFDYITKEKISKKKINFTIKYTQNKEDIVKKYEIEPIELPPGEELSKLIIYNKILKSESEEDKIKLALKYQLFIEGTSLFTEIELSGKIIEAMEKREIKHEKKKTTPTAPQRGIKLKKKESNNSKTQKMLDDKIAENEIKLNDLEARTNALEDEAREKLKTGDKAGAKRILLKQEKLIDQMKQIEGAMAMMEEQKMMLDNTLQMRDVMSAIKCGSVAVKESSKGMSVEDLENMEDIKPDQEELNEFFKEYDKYDSDFVNDKLEQLERECEGKDIPMIPMAAMAGCNEDDLNQFLACDSEPIKIKEEKKEKEMAKKTEKKESLNLDLKNKEDVMKIINCQDFVNGYWDINDKTKNVKNKYEKEFKLLKKLKNIDDILAMTIIIIYFINKEHKELLDELLMILKKAKIYIQDKVGDSYENIIIKAGIK